MQLNSFIDVNKGNENINLEVISVKLSKKEQKIKLFVITNDIVDYSETEMIKKEIQDQFNGYFDVEILIEYKGENLDTQYFFDKYKKNIEYLLECKYLMLRKKINSLKVYEENGQVVIETDSFVLNQKMIEDKIDVFLSKKIQMEYNVNLSFKFNLSNNKKIIDNDNIIDAEIKKNMSSENSKNSVSTKKETVKSSKKEAYKYTKDRTKNENIKLIKIEDVNDTVEKACIEGKIIELEEKELRTGKILTTFSVTDLTDTIYVKYFCQPKDKLDYISKGVYVRVKGNVIYDNYMRQTVIMTKNIKKINPVEGKIDTADKKRVELHLHTVMSSMDAVNEFKDYANKAKKWGHKAIAITDHGVVQGFPEAMKCADDKLKVIYGMEGYLVNDGSKITNKCKDRKYEDDIIVFDIETTGLNQKKDAIIEIGAVKINNKKIVDKFNTLIFTEKIIPEKIVGLTGITNDMLKDQINIEVALTKFKEFIGNDSILVAHNANFDVGFIKEKFKSVINFELDYPTIDTLELSRSLIKNIKNYKLNSLAKKLKIKLDNHHRAVDDAKATADLLLRLFEMLENRQIENIGLIDKNLKDEIDFSKKPTYHIIILVKNYIGLKNLYKLVSNSHLKNFYKKPRVLKSELTKYREGLIIGTACEAGELFKAVLNGVDDSEIERIIELYDYLEVQPIENNSFLVRNGILEDENDLIDINKKIIELGDKYNKLVVATGDVHFLEKKDELFRCILMTGQGFKDAEDQAPLYFMTTDEMLEKFNYLDKQKAFEIVVENTNIIADSIENILPIPNGTFPPVIEGSEEELREMTFRKARSIYGEVLPEIVKARLERELNSIISNGYAVMYIIANKLVKKSLEDGYIVGSRGSVGSSFVATMSDITEVNPLKPHYVCKKCKYSEFILDNSVGSGVDLKDKLCPNCGEMFIKDGHDIPFEVFLGFEGDKEPDIDLNFAAKEQTEAMKYTEKLFGDGKVFRAGTISTIASKTAYGFVKNFYDDKDIVKRNAEINRVVSGCTGIKKTSGQHPGGVMVVPHNKDILDFTPVQYPANNVDSGVITTHFDYHSISGRILKLDILGHDTPTIIKILENLTGVDNSKVPLDDNDTMKLFASPDIMDVTKEDINCETGTLGIPEFGTSFVRQMLLDTKPKTFSDLVRISGLSHGTDVWLNNAQELIRGNVVKIKDVISTRDDIMIFLIHNGLPKKKSFDIMERVRKGKGLTDDDVEVMNKNNIPQWYIDSCRKIKYMFPKAHAVAYVTMSVKIAYFKIHYPEAFYASYFTMKAEDFDAEIITKGDKIIFENINNILKKGNDKTAKEKSLLTVLEVAYEMYKRGYRFTKVDLYKSDDKEFKLSEKGIIPPLISLQGVGQNAAKRIKEERKIKSFISVEDLSKRTKVSKTVIEVLEIHGCLKDLDKTNQITIFNV